MKRSRTSFVVAAGLGAALALGVASSSAMRSASAVAVPRVGTINPDSGKVKSLDTRAVIADVPDGNLVTVTAADASGLTYSLRIPLSTGETLAALPGGGVAVTVPAPADTGSQDDVTVAPPDTEPSTPDIVGPVPDNPADPTDNPDTGPVDTTGYPDGGSVAPDRDGMGVVADALAQANGSLVAAAVDPPAATDANGRAVLVTLGVVSDRVIVSIAPDAGVVFPVSISLLVGFDMDYEAPSPTLDTFAVKSAQASCSPGDGPQVVVSYDGQGWQALATALAARSAPCATYYVLVPTTLDSVPRPGSAARIRAFDAKNAVGARFLPVSLLNYGNVDATFDGARFTATLRAAGYETWAIDEAPSGLLVANSPDWAKLIALVTGLASGGRQGIVLDVYTRQASSLPILRGYKTQLKRLLSTIAKKPNFEWQALGSGTAYWAEETYTQCSLVCIPGKKLGAMAERTNEYIQHTPRLAFATDAPDAAADARDFLQTRYLPLTNDWWSNKAHDAYQTRDLGLPTMWGLVSLQVYAARAWMTGTNPYAGSRIGIRWNGTPPARQKNPVAAQAALAGRIAAAIKGAYQQGGTARGACKSPKGGGGVSVCQPTGGTAFTTSWSIFRAWGARTTQGGGGGPTCPSFEGGPQPNDSFANAEPIDTRELHGSTSSFSSVFDGATLEADEVAVDAPVGVIPCTTVWYSFTAVRTDIYEFLTNVRGNSTSVSPPFIALWTGSALSPGALTLVASASNNAVEFSTGAPMSDFSFNGTAGQTYYLQVGNVADQPEYSEAFTITWSRD